MSGKKLQVSDLEVIDLTPEMAFELLSHNQNNRPLSNVHVQRIANQITEGKWHFNGDTIKIARTGDVLDGQHRLWAVTESKRSIRTIVVRGIEKEAFSTIDTIRRSRSGSDTLALTGLERNRVAAASALAWLLRWQRSVLDCYRAPANKIENSDIEEAYYSHPDITKAVERCRKLARIANHGVLSFLFYIIASHNQEIAERLIQTLENPASVGIEDPFYLLRAYLLSDKNHNKDPVMTIALTIKAANYISAGRCVGHLKWVAVGKTAEPFPILNIGRPHEKKSAARG